MQLPAVPPQKLSQVVGLVVLANDGRPGNSRTRTDCILPSHLVRGVLAVPPAGPYGGPGRLRTLAGNGREDIVRMLLDREDVSPSTADEGGRTPLLWAAGNGHEDVVKMLLELEDVTPNAADKNGRTPLFKM